jgi:23S rRNA pseudouridine2605 synthase
MSDENTPPIKVTTAIAPPTSSADGGTDVVKPKRRRTSKAAADAAMAEPLQQVETVAAMVSASLPLPVEPLAKRARKPRVVKSVVAQSSLPLDAPQVVPALTVPVIDVVQGDARPLDGAPGAPLDTGRTDSVVGADGAEGGRRERGRRGGRRDGPTDRSVAADGSDVRTNPNNARPRREFRPRAEGIPTEPDELASLPVFLDVPEMSSDESSNDEGAPKLPIGARLITGRPKHLQQGGGRGGKGSRGPAENLDPDDEAFKLHKVLAEAGLGSRRDMEEMIVAGRVSVNGQPAHVGQRIGPRDQIKVNGKPIRRRLPAKGQGALLPRVMLYHKNAGEICTRDDPEHRATVFDRLPRLQNARWVAVGRLDFNTEGLLVFTTSGDLANKLMHPRYGWEREYAVRVLGRIEPEQQQKLLEGIELEDGLANFTRCEAIGGEGANSWYKVSLTEGRNREVRRMIESIGLTVSRLVRVRFGPVSLPRSLSRGRWGEISPEDVSELLRLIRVHNAHDGDDADQDENDTGYDRQRDEDGDFDVPEDELQPAFLAEAYDKAIAAKEARTDDDEWQPKSSDAHLEGITRSLRKRDGGPNRGRNAGAGFAGQRNSRGGGNSNGNGGGGGGRNRRPGGGQGFGAGQPGNGFAATGEPRNDRPRGERPQGDRPPSNKRRRPGGGGGTQVGTVPASGTNQAGAGGTQADGALAGGVPAGGARRRRRRPNKGGSGQTNAA